MDNETQQIINNLKCVCRECLKNTPTISNDYLRSLTYKQRCNLLNKFCFDLIEVSKDFEILEPVSFAKECIIEFVRKQKKIAGNKKLSILTTRMFQFELLIDLRFDKRIKDVELFYEQYLEGLTNEKGVMYVEFYEGCPLLFTNKFFKIPLKY